MNVRQLAIPLAGVSLILFSEPTVCLQQPARERAELAASGRQLRQSTPAPRGSAATLVQALDMPSFMVLDSGFEGDPASAGVYSELGVLRPRAGEDMVLLSTGIAGSLEPEPGTDFVPIGVEQDSAVLTVRLAVPPGPATLSFEYFFLSAEWPEFGDDEFDDAFTVTVADALGEREMLEITVNNSRFSQGSNARVGGTGFDMLAEDPEHVDREFGSGLPDAGFIGFLSAEEDVRSNGEVVVVFSIEDAGDGILDSAVLIDDVRVSSLEVLDPNEILLRPGPEAQGGGRVTTDEQALATAGTPRSGAVADGVTRLVLRASVAGPGYVTFTLDGDSPEDGGLSWRDNGDRLPTVTVPVFETEAGFFATCIYRTPEEFNRGGDEALVVRLIGIEASYQPGAGEVVRSEAEIGLFRPPLLFVHGLWSRRSTWSFPLASDRRFRRLPTDYGETNAAHFHQNSAIVPGDLAVLRSEMRDAGIAVTQVDVIGHSMGGLLTRLWIQNRNHRRVDNFYSGDVNKFFTLDTPHTGSPLANLLQSIWTTPLVGFVAARLFEAMDLVIDQGAIEDLSVGSTAIAGIEETGVPTHAVVGVGGSELFPQVTPILTQLAFLVDLFSTTGIDDLYAGLEHDVIVARESQEGGATAPAYTVVGGGDGIHIGGGSIPGNTGSIVYSELLSALIDTPATSPLFSNFPAPSSLRAPDLSRTPFESAVRGIADGTLVITFPEDGTIVEPGQTVTVTVAPSVGLELAEVVVVLPGTAARVVGGLDLEVVVPERSVGPVNVLAAGKTPAGDLVLSAPTTLYVQPGAGLEAIRIEPQRPILVGVGSSLDLVVEGSYADEVVRDISSPATGTEYLLSDPAVLRLSGSRIEALSEGAATVVARNADVHDSVTVEVRPLSDSLFYIFADDFESGDLATWSSGVSTP